MGKKTAKERQMAKAAGLGGAGLSAKPSSSKVQVLKFDDGTEMPVGRPAGIDDAQYEKVLEYLKANPELAREQMEKTQQMLQHNPMMAQSLMAQQYMMANPQFSSSLATLKDDPELAEMFEEIKTKGPEALSKYWDDTDMMSKISQKMEKMKVQVAQEMRSASGEQSNDAGNSKQPKVKSITVETIHDAAKVGDVAVLLRFIDADKDSVNSKDARGIAPLGVAVGFNRIDAVKTLLASGADPNITDPKGNSPLHYACGYGRKECAELLIKGGAKVDLQNLDSQTPLAVAELNREAGMVKFMREQSGGASADQFL